MKRFIQHLLLGALFLVGTMAWATPAPSATTPLNLAPMGIDYGIDDLENSDNFYLTGTTDEESLSATLNQKNYTAVLTGNSFRVRLPSSDIATLPRGINSLTFTGESGLVFSRNLNNVASGILLNADSMAHDKDTAANEASYILVATTSNLGGKLGTTARTYYSAAQAPDLIVDISPSSYIAGQTGVVTFTFSSAVSDFSADNVTLDNGSISQVTKVSSTVYTAVLTADAAIVNAVNLLTIDCAWTFDSNAPLAATTYQSSPYELNTMPPEILTVAMVTDDNSINSVEDDAAVSITGTSSGLDDGASIALTLDGNTYLGTGLFSLLNFSDLGPSKNIFFLSVICQLTWIFSRNILLSQKYYLYWILFE